MVWEISPSSHNKLYFQAFIFYVDAFLYDDHDGDKCNNIINISVYLLCVRNYSKYLNITYSVSASKLELGTIILPTSQRRQNPKKFK